jgi:hypothetical protein
MSASAMSKLAVVAAFLVVSSMLLDDVEAVGGLSCIKEMIMTRISNRLAKSPLVEKYQEAVQTAAAKFQESSELVAKMDDKEKENYFLRLVAEEVNDMKARAGQVKPSGSSQDEVIDTNIKHCFAEEPHNTEIWENWDPQEMAELYEEDNEELFSKLNGIEQEMGFALDDATKEALKNRTKSVLTDILNNEARQIAMSALSAYLSGGSTGLAALLAPFLGSLEYRLVEFLINAVVDVVTAVLGRPIEIKPASQFVAEQQQPVPAAA